jgi:hypothetical protein
MAQDAKGSAEKNYPFLFFLTRRHRLFVHLDGWESNSNGIYRVQFKVPQRKLALEKAKQRKASQSESFNRSSLFEPQSLRV